MLCLINNPRISSVSTQNAMSAIISSALVNYQPETDKGISKTGEDASIKIQPTGRKSRKNKK